MKSFLLSLVAVLGFASSAFAGDNGGGSIYCESGSKRTILQGGAGTSYNTAAVTYTIDNKSVQLVGSQNFKADATTQIVIADAAVWSWDAKIYTLKFSRVSLNPNFDYSEGIFTLYALPATVKKIKGSEKYTFTANIEAYSIDPRTTTNLNDGMGFFDKDIQVNCTMDLGV
jgi:hypothetical protein